MTISSFFNDVYKLIHSDHPLVLLLHETKLALTELWNYVLFKSGNQPVRVSNVVIGLTLFILGMRFAKFLSSAIRRRMLTNPKIDKNTAVSLEHIIHYSFILILSFFVLEIANVPLATLTVIGTTLALGIGLGSQNIVNNFISGLIIMIEKPIKLGDTVAVQDIVGKVMNIGARCVTLQTENNINMLIPNSNILQDHVINWTLNDSTLKMNFSLWVGNEASIEPVDRLILEILHNNRNILTEPEPRVLLLGMTEECLIFEIEFWIDLDKELDRKAIINNLYRAIDPLFKANGIKIYGKKRENTALSKT